MPRGIGVRDWDGFKRRNIVPTNKCRSCEETLSHAKKRKERKIDFMFLTRSVLIKEELISRFISWIDCVVTSEGCKEGGGGEKKRKEKEGDRGNGGGETRDSKCIVTFEELDYGEHSGERGHELGGQVSIEPARDALFPPDRNSSKNKARGS